MKRHQLQPSLKVARNKRIFRDKEPKRHHPFRRRRGVQERERGSRLNRTIDSHHPAPDQSVAASPVSD